MNTDILGIGELKQTIMGEINSDDHYIYSCGHNPLEEMEYIFTVILTRIPHSQQKSPKCSTWMQSQK